MVEDGTVRPSRPELLSFLCILTFIGSGISAFGYVMLTFFGEEFRELLTTSEMEKGVQGLEMLNNSSYWAICFFLSLVSFYGAVKMFKLKRIGFHLYAGSNIVILVLPLFYSMEFGISELLTVASFIGMYAVHLKYMY